MWYFLPLFVLSLRAQSASQSGPALFTGRVDYRVSTEYGGIYKNLSPEELNAVKAQSTTAVVYYFGRNGASRVVTNGQYVLDIRFQEGGNNGYFFLKELATLYAFDTANIRNMEKRRLERIKSTTIRRTSNSAVILGQNCRRYSVSSSIVGQPKNWSVWVNEGVKVKQPPFDRDCFFHPELNGLPLKIEVRDENTSTVTVATSITRPSGR